MKQSLLLFTALSLTVYGRTFVGINKVLYVGAQDADLCVDKFVGVPYAQPPVGKLRLQPPQPLKITTGTVDASSPTSAKCYGIENYLLRAGSEDCLTLDIVRPTAKFDHLLPVYVFIHGGDFNWGDKSDVDGSELVSYAESINSPFIFVSINFRLSFLGFPGGAEAGANNAYNLGLKDQRLALQWVRDNIIGFGGNKDKVVLGGQAGGADAATYQTLAFHGNHHSLFRGLLLESGAATGMTPIPYPNYTNWQTYYNNVVSLTKCPTTASFSCLQNLPVDNITNAMFYTFAQALTIPHHVYAVVVDGTLVTDYPSVAMANGRFPSLPTVIGFTTDELINRIPINANFSTNESLLGFSTAFLSYVNTTVIAEEVKLYNSADYEDIGPPGSGSQWSRVVAIDNDLQSFCPVHHAALQFARKASVWKYRFDARHSISTAPAYFKVSQDADLLFLFGHTPVNPSNPEDILSASYKRYMISFITTLNPNALMVKPRPIAPLMEPFPNLPVPWLHFSKETQNQIVFGTSGNKMELDGVNKTVCQFVLDHNSDFLR